MRSRFNLDPEDETIATFLGYYVLAYRLAPLTVRITDGGPEWAADAERAVEAELAVAAMDPTMNLNDLE